MAEPTSLLESLLDGDQRALARALTHIERRTPGYRALLTDLFDHTGSAPIVGITGSPGTGKSTLVDGLVEAWRDDSMTVGVLAVDPSSPFTGGAVLGDRVRLRARRGDPGVFVRSMSAKGALGGVAPSTADALVALEAFGLDRLVIETVGAGQSEVDVVEVADTVVVVLQPGSGDDVQMLKAGILEIGDVFVVNKSDLPGVDRTVRDLEAMLEGGDDRDDTDWRPPIVETVATDGTGIEPLLAAIEGHRSMLERTDGLTARRRERIAATIRRHLRADIETLVTAAVEREGGVDVLVDRVLEGTEDPYTIAARLTDCLDRDRSTDAAAEPSADSHSP